MKEHTRPALLALGLLVVAASARLLLQIAVMPPYAGLDEAYHVARLTFRLQEGRNPNSEEPSVPIYVHETLAGAANAVPAFGPAWPSIARPLSDRVVGSRDYFGKNYEAQQPSLYYSITAPLAFFLQPRTQLGELRVWRLASAAWAVLIVAMAGVLAWRKFGLAGLLAAALLSSFPTWLTLVARASNDALASAMLAIALCVTLSHPRHNSGYVGEAAAWGLALAAKLYSWPVAIVLPIAWYLQRAGRRRIVLTLLAGLLAVGLTVADLALRTGNPLGLFAFDPVPVTNAPSSEIDYVEMVKIWIATLIWTSGPHWNALRPPAMLIYFGPVLIVALAGLIRAGRRDIVTLLAVILSFAGAQAVNAWGYIRFAHEAGLSLPAGGKEGWYWYVLAPLILVWPLSVVIQQRGRIVAGLLTFWIAAWDVLLHEGGLFRDYAALTSPQRPSIIMRWGPLDFDIGMYERLEGLAVGPLSSGALALRLIHLIALASLVALVLPYINKRYVVAPESPAGAKR